MNWHMAYWLGVPLTLGLLCAAVADAFVDQVGIASEAEAERMYDLKQAYQPAPNPAITLVSFSEETRQKLPSWQGTSLSRRNTAALIRKLRSAQARVLLVDLVFGEPRPDDDADLISAIKEPGMPALTFASSGDDLGDDPSEPDGKIWSYYDLSYLGIRPGNDRIRPAGNQVLFTGGIDKGAVLYRWDKRLKRAIPHVSLSAVLQYQEIPESQIQFDQGSHELRAGPLEWTLQGNDGILIQWTSDPSPFPKHDLYDVLHIYSPDQLKRAFKDKLVIFGMAEKGRDEALTERGRLFGIEFHAQVVNMLLLPPSGRLRDFDQPWADLWLLSLGCLAAAAALSPRFFWSSFGGIVLLALAYWTPEAVVRSQFVTMETVPPVLAVLFAFGLGAVARAWIPKPGRPSGAEFEATVMFIDIRSSTEMLQRVGQQRYRILFSKVSRHITQIAATFGGSVERTTGDGALVVFPSGKGRHHAVSAIECALAIKKGVAQIRDNEAGPIELRFGIESGVITGGYVREGGRPAWSSAGTAVNLASRLQDAGESLKIDVAIGPVAAPLAEAHIELSPAGEVQAHGFDRPVQVWMLKPQGENEE